MTSIDGVVPVIPIPFLPDESIDEASFKRLIDFAASQNIAAMCLPAYGSEFYKLSLEERTWLIQTAIEVNRGRVPLIAQANHGSSRHAAALAQTYQAMGADLIAFAIPRQFASTTKDLLHYSGVLLDAVSVPVLIQDFNPGGPTIDGPIIQTLHQRHDNLKYVKLEEPLIVDKLKTIRECVGQTVGILEGWGGYYMLEAIPQGICGIMPGVPLIEPLDRVYRACQQNNQDLAYHLFGALLPFINFTLQDFELFLQTEKRLLVRRGLIDHATCRSLSYEPSVELATHIEFLIDQLTRVFSDHNITFQAGTAHVG